MDQEFVFFGFYTPDPPATDLHAVATTELRKKKARTLRESDWEPYKERIIQLHITEKRQLPKVKKLIEEAYGFHAEIHQYRSRLSQWKLDKNIKPDEMKAIVRRRQQRALIETDKANLTFRVRGLEVEPQKIERWMKRHAIMDSMVYAPSPVAPTPSAISCATMSEMGSSNTYSALSPDNIQDGDMMESVHSTPRQVSEDLMVHCGFPPKPRRRSVITRSGQHVPSSERLAGTLESLKAKLPNKLSGDMLELALAVLDRPLHPWSPPPNPVLGSYGGFIVTPLPTIFLSQFRTPFKVEIQVLPCWPPYISHVLGRVENSAPQRDSSFKILEFEVDIEKFLRFFSARRVSCSYRASWTCTMPI